jgi:predicted ribosome-associated RNA-binding protein Tma20
MGLPSMPKGEIVGMFSDRRQSMMVGMFNRQSILVIDGKIRLFLWQDQIIPVIDGIDGKTGT